MTVIPPRPKPIVTSSAITAHIPQGTWNSTEENKIERGFILERIYEKEIKNPHAINNSCMTDDAEKQNISEGKKILGILDNLKYRRKCIASLRIHCNKK